MLNSPRGGNEGKLLLAAKGMTPGIMARPGRIKKTIEMEKKITEKKENLLRTKSTPSAPCYRLGNGDSTTTQSFELLCERQHEDTLDGAAAKHQAR